MVRTNNSTTLLLSLIVIILLIGVGITLYYVLDLDWFDHKPVNVYDEVTPYTETESEQNTIKNIYDIGKRVYDIELNTDEFKIIVYKDGSVGFTMKENDTYKDMANYNELLNIELKSELTNIVRVYEVLASKSSENNNHIVMLDNDGNVYRLVKEELLSNGKYVFLKIEGLSNIVDIKQITNMNLTQNLEGINAIAIDNKNNEILLTNYLLTID